MKILKKLILIVLCFGLTLSFAACSKENESDIPEGMQIASAPGADFRLYVPTVWNLNTDYGVSGAYYNLSTQSTVSMVKYPVTDALRAAMAADAVENSTTARLDWYRATQCLPVVEETALGGSLILLDEETESVLLDTLNARRYHCKANVKGVTMHFVHVVAEKGDAFYVFTFAVADELYAGLLPDVTSMLEHFRFADPYTLDEYVKEDAKDLSAPSGMKLASNDDVAYRFYVPKAWQINRDETVFSAYLESDRSNVTVVPYMPNQDSMSVAEFFAMCQELMQNTADEGGYELLSQETVDLGGRQATAYVYRYTVGGTEYRYMQVIAAYKSMLYSLTYTALPEHFDAHLADVNAMVEAFEFR